MPRTYSRRGRRLGRFPGGLTRRLVVASVLAVIGAFAAAAPSASACAPTASLGFGGLPAGTPTPPTFRPGDAVTVVGTGFGTERRNVVLTWGVNGPAAGQTPIGADGSWQLTFTIPTATPVGTYVLFADDGDVNGFMVTLAFRVDAAAPVTEPAADEPAATDDVVPVVATPAENQARPPVRPNHDRRSSQRPRTAPEPRRPAREAPAGVARPMRPRAVPPPRVLPRERHGSIARRHAHPPRLRLPAANLRPRAVPGPVALPAPPPSPFPWLLASVVFASTLAAAGTFALLLRRRRRAARAAEIEAELQELLAEERARLLQRRTRG